MLIEADGSVLIDDDDAQIADVGVGRAGTEQTAGGLKEAIGVVAA